jgi:hypothetical protein
MVLTPARTAPLTELSAGAPPQPAAASAKASAKTQY